MAEKNVTERTFRNDCKVIRLDAEYKGYTGEVRYAIITDLTEDELYSLYPNDIKRFIPFVLLSCEMGKVIRVFNRNNEKFAKREARSVSIFITCSEEEESLISSLSVADEQTRLQAERNAAEEHQRLFELSRKAMTKLTPLQRDYLIRHYIGGSSIRGIAKEDGKRFENVWDVIKKARSKYIKAINELEEVS